MSQINIVLAKISIAVLILGFFGWLIFLKTTSNKIKYYLTAAQALLISWLIFARFLSTTLFLFLGFLYALKASGSKYIPEVIFSTHDGVFFYVYLLSFFFIIWLPLARLLNIGLHRHLSSENLYFFVIFISMLNIALLIVSAIPDNILRSISIVPFLFFFLSLSMALTHTKFDYRDVVDNFLLIGLSFIGIVMCFIVQYIYLGWTGFF